MNNTLFKRVMSLLLCLVMVFGLLPTIALSSNAAADPTLLNIISGSKVADDATIDDWKDFFGPDKMDTEYAGAVWTDKSVFAGNTALLPGVSLDDTNNFLVALSAISGNTVITGHASVPTDTMLVLDLSASMLTETEYGPFEDGDYIDGVNVSNVQAMVDATNAAIAELMTQNSNNRVGVVLYSGNTSTDQAATASTATVVLPLGSYQGVLVGTGEDAHLEYLSLDTNWRTETVYEWVGRNWFNGYWRETDETITFATGSVSVSVKDGLETATDTSDLSKQVSGGTYIQNGLYKALEQFLAVEDTVVPEGKVQAGVERMPVIVLMSDGAPTIATTDYTSVGDSNVGTGSGTNDRITMLTQLTAAYVKGAVADHYKESESDEQDILFLTLGLGTSSNAAATDTLYPAGSDTDLLGYWNTYLAATAGRDVTVIPDTFGAGDTSLTVTRNSLVTAMNYVDKYYYADDADGMIDSFSQIISQIQIQAESYTTLVSNLGADLSGYVTFEDELGEMMEVSDMKGILMSDGKGGVVLYTGKGIAEGMTTGKLGTTDAPTARGDELIRTVRERIPGLTTSMAQQLVNSAYLDQQLYYENDSSWSNYIGWYANENGEFAGFWDKDSGYENYPTDAVYANKSYGYLGVEGDSDMMHVVVMVRTNLKTLHQTVLFKIPAALIPTVTYNITLAENDSARVEEFVREDALPMQLVFEVGLRSDVNSVNLEQKIEEHIANGGHVHKNADGTYSFYTNSWAIGNDKNSNGIPDPDEISTAVVAESHFHPALDNDRFYFTEDTLVLNANGQPVTGGTQPSGTGYHHVRYVYDEDSRIAIEMPLSATTLAKAQRNDAGQWYIPSGNPYLEWARFRSLKGGDSNSDRVADKNLTGTLDYSVYPAAFENAVNGVDSYAFLGNNGTFKVAPATGISLTKEITGTIADADSFTFTVALSGIPAGTVADPVVTDANGDAITGVTSTEYTGGSFDVTLPVGVTAYITGIPSGTTVTVTEKITGDYFVSKVTVDGVEQTVSQTVQVTVPSLTAEKQILPVGFVNTPNGYGDLIIEKDVHHELGTDPDALSTKVFTFTVTVSGDKIEAGDTFTTSTGAKVKVAQNGTLTFEDGTPITLHNEESITIYNLPNGTQYTVEETNIPDGFKLSTVNGTTATSASGTIETDEEDLASFVNAYPDNFETVEVDLSLIINKDLIGTPPAVETFRFALQKLLADNTYPDIKEFQITSDDADMQVSDTLTLEFDTMGTYFYRIVEKTPASPTPGMTYSTTRALFAVIVTDNDMDGVLEVAVREEANIDASYDADDGITVEATFTNVYEVHSTSVSVNVHKNLVNNTGVNIPLTEFRFGLYNVDASGNATGDPIQTVTTSALGDATFNIRITEDKDLSYIIKEIVPSNKRVGMTYDPAEYVLTIAVDADNAGQLSAITSAVLRGKEAEGGKDIVFTNTYTLTPTAVSFPWGKQLNGLASVAQEKQFRFELYRTDDTYQRLSGSDAYTAFYFTNSTANATISIDNRWVGGVQVPVIDKVGTYHFAIIEVIPDAAEAIKGMTYDPSTYHISFTVTDNGNGAMVASTPVIYKVGQTTPADRALFVNTYTVSGSDSVVIDGKKALDGRAPVTGEFTFGLYTDLNADPIQTATNRADGTFVFDALNFTAANLGSNSATQTYTYYVKEILPDGVDSSNTLNGVTYDTTVHTVTVEVSHDGAGNLVVTPSNNHTNSIQINNTYSAEGVDVTLYGNKNLVGDWTAVENKDFTFQLYEADESFQVTNPTPVTIGRTGSGNFTFNLSYADGQEGYHYYILREDRSAAASGVNYDATIFRITVNVTDPGNGKLAATVQMYHPGTGNVAVDETLGAPIAQFNNIYSVTATQITLEGGKELSGRDMIEGEFEFAVLEDDVVVSTGTNEIDGSITFKPITYTEAGEHTYTVVEALGSAGGVTYDNTTFTVTVTVTDNGDGTLSTNVVYEKDILFKNSYDPDAATADISGSKELTGRDLVKDEFKFQLLENGVVVKEATNTTDGKFTFGTITYTEVGTHTYTIQEVKGTATGVTYDDAVYTVTVTVTDNGEGKLSAAVAYSDEVVFQNTYEVPDIPVTGDSFNLFLCCAVLLISGMAMLTLVIFKKKFAV